MTTLELDFLNLARLALKAETESAAPAGRMYPSRDVRLFLKRTLRHYKHESPELVLRLSEMLQTDGPDLSILRRASVVNIDLQSAEGKPGVIAPGFFDMAVESVHYGGEASAHKDGKVFIETSLFYHGLCRLCRRDTEVRRIQTCDILFSACKDCGASLRADFYRAGKSKDD